MIVLIAPRRMCQLGLVKSFEIKKCYILCALFTPNSDVSMILLAFLWHFLREDGNYRKKAYCVLFSDIISESIFQANNLLRILMIFHIFCMKGY